MDRTAFGPTRFESTLNDVLLTGPVGRSRLECVLEAVRISTGARQAFLLRRTRDRWRLLADTGERVGREESWAEIRRDLGADLDEVLLDPDAHMRPPIRPDHTYAHLLWPLPSRTGRVDHLLGIRELPAPSVEAGVDDLLPWSRVAEILAALDLESRQADAPLLDLARLNTVLPGAWFVMGPTGRFLWWDPPRTEAILGTGDMEGLGPKDFFTAEHQVDVMSAFRHLMQEGQVRACLPVERRPEQGHVFLASGRIDGATRVDSPALVGAIPVGDTGGFFGHDSRYRELFRTSPQPGAIGPLEAVWSPNARFLDLLGLHAGHPDPAATLRHEGRSLVDVVREALFQRNSVYLEQVTSDDPRNQRNFASFARRFGPVSSPWVHLELIDEATAERSSVVLAEARSLLRQYTESIPVPTIHWDVSGRVLDWNQAAVELFGHRRSEAIGRPLLELIVPEDQRPFVENKIYEIVAGKSTGFTRNYNVTREGRRILCEWHSSLIESLGHEGPFVVSAALDMTSTVEDQRERILAVARQRDALVREVHHRVKNSLQGIIGLFRMRAMEAPEQEEAVTELIGQIEAIAAAFGLTSRGAASSVSLGELVTEIAKRLHAETAVPIVTELGALSGADLDPDHAVLVAVVVNELVQNACKHRGTEAADEPVRIEGRRTEHETAVRITNATGIEGLRIDMEHGSGLGTGLTVLRTLTSHPPLGLHFETPAPRLVRAHLSLHPDALVESARRVG